MNLQSNNINPPSIATTTSTINSGHVTGGLVYDINNEGPSVTLSATQIETLQLLIRQFKSLTKRFQDSRIPALIQTNMPNDLTGRSNAPPNNAPQALPLQAQSNMKLETTPNLTSQVPDRIPVNNMLPSNAMNMMSGNGAQMLQQAQMQIPQQTMMAHSTNVASINNQLHTTNDKVKTATPVPVNNIATAAQNPPVPQQPTTPSLSWQCFHSMLFYGAGKLNLEGSVSLPPSELSCFSKGANLPLVLTTPALTSLREEMISKYVAQDTSEEAKLYKQQRMLRALLWRSGRSFLNVADEKISTLAPSMNILGSNLSDEYSMYRNFHRVRKQSKRELKNWEKEDKRRRNDGDDKKKRKLNEFFRVLLDHRENFVKYHKVMRGDATKVSRAVKLLVESNESRRDRDEAKAEMRRIQALKENDMEAYTSLLEETKNGRLKYLLSETDNYIATINRLVQEQRDGNDQNNNHSSSGSVDSHGENDHENDVDGDGTTTTNGNNAGKQENKVEFKSSKDYYRTTHRTTETVIQPSMLKGGDLKEYQLSGLQWLVSLYNNNLNGILADEMGLGKTIQTIALITYLMEFKNNKGPFLIVVPLSTLSNWVNEFNKWAPDVIKVVYKGTPDERRRIFRDDIETGRLNVLLTTYEFIMKDKSYLKKLMWQYVIVDEGHRMKNAQSKFAVTLGSQYSSKNRILLTGTPLQNNLPELWALLNFLLPSIFSSVDTFDQWFNKPFSAFRNQTAVVEETAGGESTVLSQEERLLIVHRLHEVLRPFMLRRVKDQVLDQLPEKVEKVLRCALSGWQRKMYYSIAAKGLTNKDKDGTGSTSTVSGLNNTIMQLRKVCNHPYLFLANFPIDDDLIRVSGKFELLSRMLPKLRAAGHRVLIFSQMVEVMRLLENFLIYKNMQFLRLDGGTTSDEREKRMYTFNDPDSPYFLFLLSTRAGGLGLNLATADTVIIFDSDWNPMMDAQAQDRAHRIGQKNEVRVFRLLTNSLIEERILARANDKRNLTGLVVEAGKFNATGAKPTPNALEENKEMMEALLKEYSMGGGPAESTTLQGQYDASTAMGNDQDQDLPDEDQLNEMMAAYDGEMEIYTKIDAQLLANNNMKKPPLMAASEKLSWLTEANWPSKYQSLKQDMMYFDEKTGSIKKPRPPRADNDDHGSMDSDDQDNDGDDPNVVTIGGKAMRKRKDVTYDDGMTEFQFKKYLERNMDETGSTDAGATSAAVVTMKTPAKANKRPAAVISSSPPTATALDIVKAIQEIQKMRRADGSFIAELFLEKPPKKFYPDYYQIIEQPISLKEISQKLKQGQYTYFEELELDVALMAHNARVYNSEESPVFHTCETIRDEFYKRCREIFKRHGHDISAVVMRPLPVNGYQIFSDDCKFELNVLNQGGFEELSLTISTKKRKLVK